MRKGSTHSEDAKAKISATKTGQPHDPHHSQMISEALKGRKKTEEHKKAISVGIKAARARRAAELALRTEVVPSVEA